jgi:hypothetical protein
MSGYQLVTSDLICGATNDRSSFRCIFRTAEIVILLHHPPNSHAKFIR